MGGGDETGSEDQPREQAKQFGEDVHENLMEKLNSRATLTEEGEIGVALDAATVEPEDDKAMAIEENTEMVTIESSPKWGGTLIEEEHPRERENDRTGNIPSTSAMNPENPTPQRKRKRSKDEIKVSPPIRRKRTRLVVVAEAAREIWETLEAQIEFPILKPKPIDTPQGPVEEEPQIEGLLFENRLLKEEVQTLRKELENWKEACRK